MIIKYCVVVSLEVRTSKLPVLFSFFALWATGQAAFGSRYMQSTCTLTCGAVQLILQKSVFVTTE